jgi:hypothetical protein
MFCMKQVAHATQKKRKGKKSLIRGGGGGGGGSGGGGGASGGGGGGGGGSSLQLTPEVDGEDDENSFDERDPRGGARFNSFVGTVECVHLQASYYCIHAILASTRWAWTAIDRSALRMQRSVAL